MHRSEQQESDLEWSGWKPRMKCGCSANPYHHFNRLDIEVYTDYKDPDMEATIEEVLTAHELYYEKSEVWIETEKMYEVLYELTV